MPGPTDLRTRTDPRSSDFADGDQFGFFFTAPATHHLYYLLPYVRATDHQSVLVFGPTEDYLALLHRTFPDVIFLPFGGDEMRPALDELSRYAVLIFANGYSWFVNNVQPHLPPETLLVRVLHGTSHKFADDANLYFHNVYALDALIVFGRKDMDLFYEFSGVDPQRREYAAAIVFPHKTRGHFMLVQAGNLRVEDFLESGPARELIAEDCPFLVPEKKTVLVMPTHPINADETVLTYSSLAFFLELLEEFEAADRHNFLFKLHPNLAKEAVLMRRLHDICGRKGIALGYDMFTADYLPMMRIADVLITDRTSAMFDFLYFDRPIVFLDNTGECPEALSWQDTRNPFWSFRNGPVVAPRNQARFGDVLSASLRKDDYRKERRKTLDYAFSDSGHTAPQVMSSLLSHPKSAQS